jgi:hypothetical protein
LYAICGNSYNILTTENFTKKGLNSFYFSLNVAPAKQKHLVRKVSNTVLGTE